MRARGDELAGVRLDSGDLLQLSISARAALDEAGFPAVKIVASDDLDEHRITSLLDAGAPLDVFGVGTRLVTGGQQPSLGVVYKLSEVREGPDAPARAVMKLSSEPVKRSLPGYVSVQRVLRRGRLVEDVLHVSPRADDLLRPAIRAGRLVDSEGLGSLEGARRRAEESLATLAPEARCLVSPTAPGLRLSAELATTQSALVARAANDIDSPEARGLFN